MSPSFFVCRQTKSGVANSASLLPHYLILDSMYAAVCLLTYKFLPKPKKKYGLSSLFLTPPP